MATIKITDTNGISHLIEGSEGWTVMEVAKRNNIAGIEAECGGACACATCHVYVASDWVDKLQQPSDAELEMLDFASNRQAHSRLSCQLVITRAFDGLELTVP